MAERISPESTDEDTLNAADDAVGMGGFQDALNQALNEVESALGTIPEGLAEARRIIIERFWPSPKPEELQTIVKIAEDPVAAGARGRNCRTILALRLLANRELHAFWEGMPAHVEEIRRRAAILDGVRCQMAQTRQDMNLAETGMGPLGAEDTQLLRQAIIHLMPPEEPILAAVLLAPLLADLLEAAAGDRPREAVPTLSDTEIRLLRPEAAAVTAPEAAGPDLSAFRRCALDVAALRWMIHQTATAWETQSAGNATPGGRGGGPATDSAALGGRGGGPATDNAMPPGRGGGPAYDDEALGVLRRRAQEQELVYLFVSNRLQKLQDEALMGRRKAEVDLLFQIRRPLSTSHATLAPVLQNLRAKGKGAYGLQALNAAGDPSDEPSVSIEDGEFEQIFRQATEIPQSPASPSELPAGNSDRAEETDRKRRVGRIFAMGCVAAALAIVAFVVHALLPEPLPAPVEFSPSDSISLRLSATEPIGTLLYAQVTSEWEGLTPSERIRRITDLSLAAGDHGLVAIHLVDQNRDPVADWDSQRGVRLIAPPEPDPKP